MYKVYAHKHNEQGEHLKARMLWASFRIEGDAYKFVDDLKKNHPTWKIDIDSPNCKR